jgi:hypothetical protein
MATLTGFDIYIDRHLTYRKATFSEGDDALTIHSATSPQTNQLAPVDIAFTEVTLVSGTAKTSMVFTAVDSTGAKVAIVAKTRGGCGCGGGK